MSNTVSLDHIRLTYPSALEGTADVDEGWLLQDDYARELEFVYDGDVPTDDLELLSLVLERSIGTAEDILLQVQSNKIGMYINSVWYNWETIEQLWE